MVSHEEVNRQLKALGFNRHGWGRAEVGELPNILLPDEEILELVNGIYEGGFAIIVATDVRLLLIDKKPLNYLTVEDIRFDMINELDYSHRLLGAQISIATGSKNLHFRSYNQARLRKVIGHVQHAMADGKRKQSSHQKDQSLHLENINQQLQAYLSAQHQYQMQLQQAQMAQQLGQAVPPVPEPVKPAPELADYLFAQSLLAQHQNNTGQFAEQPPLEHAVLFAPPQPSPVAQEPQHATVAAVPAPEDTQLKDMYNEGLREVFGKRLQQQDARLSQPIARAAIVLPFKPLEINPLRIAYSKLPMALRNRKFGRPLPYSRTAIKPDHPINMKLDFDSAIE
jgi:Bacterial PH domain